MIRFVEPRCLLAGLVGAAILTGCAAKEPPPPPPPPPPAPASAATVDSIRSALMASFPNVKVAAVAEVLPNDPYLATTEIDPADFPLETIVTVLDGNSNPIAHGQVEKLLDNRAHIRFVADPSAARRPQLGDVVVAGLTNN